MGDLENSSLRFLTIEEFLMDLKQEFGNKDDKSVKLVKLKKVKQGSKIIKKFVEKFKKVARDSSFERRPLIEEFKREINGVIQRKLIKSERSPRSIKQKYKRATNLDKYQRKSRQEKERLKERKKIETQASRTNILANIKKVQRQWLLYPQVWPRRQKMQQQVPTESVPMKEVEKTVVTTTSQDN